MSEPSIDDTTVVVAASHAVAATTGGEAIILDPVTSRYFGLDGVGGRVWALVQRPTSVAALVEVLLTEYDVDRATLEADVAALLRELVREGLLRIADEPAR